MCIGIEFSHHHCVSRTFFLTKLLPTQSFNLLHQKSIGWVSTRREFAFDGGELAIFHELLIELVGIPIDERLPNGRGRLRDLFSEISDFSL